MELRLRHDHEQWVIERRRTLDELPPGARAAVERHGGEVKWTPWKHYLRLGEALRALLDLEMAGELGDRATLSGQLAGLRQALGVAEARVLQHGRDLENALTRPQDRVH